MYVKAHAHKAHAHKAHAHKAKNAFGCGGLLQCRKNRKSSNFLHCTCLPEPHADLQQNLLPSECALGIETLVFNRR